jgi:hypothetical protein
MILIAVRHAAPTTYTPRDKQTRFSTRNKIKVVEPPKCSGFEFKPYQVNDSSQSNQGTDHLISQIWLRRNDVIFNKTKFSSYMQVIFRGTHWARTLAIFQKEEKWKVLQTACWLIETLTMEIFAKHRWWFSNRLSL